MPAVGTARQLKVDYISRNETASDIVRKYDRPYSIFRNKVFDLGIPALYSHHSEVALASAGLARNIYVIKALPASLERC
jgi:hypothetical protein